MLDMEWDVTEMDTETKQQDKFEELLADVINEIKEKVKEGDKTKILIWESFIAIGGTVECIQRAYQDFKKNNLVK